MHIKRLLTQALLFEKQSPIYSSVKELFSAIKKYEGDNEVFVLEGKRGERVELKNTQAFFAFVSEVSGVSMQGFDAIKNYFNAATRKENIEFGGDSKNRYFKVFDGVVLIKKKGEVAKLYQKQDLCMLEQIERFVAVENGETFLTIDTKAEHFSSEYFVYLGGYANTLTRSFLETKEVEFFVDYDIEGIRIYESFQTKNKTFHMPRDLERYFMTPNFHSQKLYQKQRGRMQQNYPKELEVLTALIKKYASVVEQEIIYEA
ncbi:MAG TPA: hypothetical protein CFH84_11465 [Sulfurimonas sp. UBA12504]|nr:MAG: hypothetical protein A2019_03645 [Sulfurimonas sp. GWF2_37_8]DAB29077.1 MAG TPA: hypothetical protein CFH84_11465 [Sulfurimonas sp. UBA12504]